MAHVQIHFEYRFQNVGQGLFGFGQLGAHSDPHPWPQLHWVFDCGTVSSDELVTSGLSYLERRFDKPNLIDLVTISHFDNDHISGMCELLKRFRVDALLLPYVAREVRMTLASAQGVKPGDPLFGFYDNPVRYLITLPGATIDRIVFVLPGGPPPPRGPDDRRPAPANADRPGGLLIPDGPPLPEPELEAPATGRTAAQTVMNGDPLTFRDVWEFVPYNDMTVPLRAGGPKKFTRKVAALRDALRTAPAGSPTREDSLQRLRALYDNAFGAGSRQRNQISLHLYAGPIGVSDIDIHRAYGAPYVRHGRNLRAQRMDRFASHSRASAVLYTGDGYLNTPAKLKQMFACLFTERIRRVGVFQVMHHGAKGNWHKGVADRIAPDFSVFSSDPHHERLRHPNLPVVEDFMPYLPLQVDDKRYAHFQGDGHIEVP